MKNKSAAVVRHFKQRMQQRHGVKLTDNDMVNINKAVEDGNSYFIELQSRRVVVLDIPIRGKMFRVVYDLNRKAPITTLYPGKEALLCLKRLL